MLLPVDAALAEWRRLDLPADGVQAFRQGQTVVGHRRNAPEMCASTRRAWDFSDWGRLRPPGRLVPLRLISTATNRA